MGWLARVARGWKSRERVRGITVMGRGDAELGVYGVRFSKSTDSDWSSEASGICIES